MQGSENQSDAALSDRELVCVAAMREIADLRQQLDRLEAWLERQPPIVIGRIRKSMKPATPRKRHRRLTELAPAPMVDAM